MMLNFKMPTDVDDKRGVYEMGSNQQAMFSGLYRVIQVEHSFDSGKYTNVLHLTRFNNQGVYISAPSGGVQVHRLQRGKHDIGQKTVSGIPRN